MHKKFINRYPLVKDYINGLIGSLSFHYKFATIQKDIYMENIMASIWIYDLSKNEWCVIAIDINSLLPPIHNNKCKKKCNCVECTYEHLINHSYIIIEAIFQLCTKLKKPPCYKGLECPNKHHERVVENCIKYCYILNKSYQNIRNLKH